MSGVATFNLDRDFFEEYYRDWLRHVRPWKRLLLPAAIAGLVAGLGILIFAPRYLFTGLVVSVICTIETINGASRKARWMRRMKETPGYGSEVTIEFADEAVRVQTVTSDSQLKWSHFKKWTATPSGLFLHPQNGFAIYVPDRALTPQATKASIMDKLSVTKEPLT